ncbi:ABC transporter ATP-binding protein [Micromonospora sp. STR1s_5]|nr:ABC transporter ATP-binding protein [Micromonospora sp. STR1s_5]
MNTYYGPAHVLCDVSFEVAEGTVLSLMGRNGAGKSTTLKTMMGMIRARSGVITFRSKPIQELESFEISRLGLGYVPEERRVFSEMSVEENLAVAARPGAWERAHIYREFPILEELRKRQAGLLSGGQQQMLTISRTLVSNPSMILIDEPTEGLAPVVVRALESMITGLKDMGLTIVIAAQDLRFAARIADQIIVMDKGRVTHRMSGASGRDDLRALAAILAA